MWFLCDAAYTTSCFHGNIIKNMEESIQDASAMVFATAWELYYSPVYEVQISKPHQQLVFSSSVGNLVTSLIPTCSNDSAAVEVVARPYIDVRHGDGDHSGLFVRIDYICIGHDGQQVSGSMG